MKKWINKLLKWFLSRIIIIMPALRIGKDFCCVFFLFSFRMMSGYLQLFSVHICSNVTDYSLIFYIQRVKEFCRHQLLTRCMCVWGGHSFVCILFRVIATPCTSRSIYHRTDNCFLFLCVSLYDFYATASEIFKRWVQ